MNINHDYRILSFELIFESRIIISRVLFHVFLRIKYLNLISDDKVIHFRRRYLE